MTSLVPEPRVATDRLRLLPGGADSSPKPPAPRSASEIKPVRIEITRSQRAVLVELTRDGPTNRVIANRLGLTEDTIKCHIKAVLAKLPHVHDRTALAVALLRRAVVTTTVTRPAK